MIHYMFALQYYYEFPMLFQAFNDWMQARRDVDESRDDMIRLRTAYESARVDATCSLCELYKKDTLALHQNHIRNTIEEYVLPNLNDLHSVHQSYVLKRRIEEEALNTYRQLSIQTIPLQLDFIEEEPP